ETPPELTLHLIVDNYATHKHPAVRAWLARHPRLRQHFTPTSSSWLNLVERFFRDLTEEVVREGSFQSVGELVRTIEVWLAERNRQPQRYVWRAEGSAILKKITRARAKLEEIKADTSRTAHWAIWKRKPRKTYRNCSARPSSGARKPRPTPPGASVRSADN